MTDIVHLTGKHYARKPLADAWVAAGRPPINSALRLHGEQKWLWDGWQAGESGFNPADNPDDTSQQLAHVRGVALDIDPTPSRVAALEAAGLVRPYAHEPWHWTLPGDMRRFPIVHALPKPTTLEDDMGFYCSPDKNATVYWYSCSTRRVQKLTEAERRVVVGGKSIAELKIKAVGAGWLAQALGLGS